jgi:tripartite-type tricarboxylate transporter receptor subunit TctC
MDAWVGVLVPAGTPREIIALLNREIVKIVALPDVKRRLAALGACLARRDDRRGQRHTVVT